MHLRCSNHSRFKCSVHIVDVQLEEILQAVAKVKTRDARRAMSYLHADEFVDTQTLLAFPTSAEHKTPSYSYRVIKWALLKAGREVPTLERYDILRGQFVRTSILVTERRQFNILKITAVAQVDGALVPAAVRLTMEEIMLDFVGGGLLELRPTAH
ncbi:hypothetical protein PRIC2_014054 [Phytophthora ramorum]